MQSLDWMNGSSDFGSGLGKDQAVDTVHELEVIEMKSPSEGAEVCGTLLSLRSPVLIQGMG